MVQAHTYKVLLCGSGLMTPPLIDYLCKFGDTHITVASNLIEDARKICQRHPGHMKAEYLDVFDVSSENPLLSKSDKTFKVIFVWIDLLITRIGAT